MYAGHFAAGLGIKGKVPAAPTWGLLVGVGVLDGLWRVLPTGWWFVELLVIAAGVGYYWHRARTEQTFGRRAWAVGLVVLLLHIINSPWLSAL